MPPPERSYSEREVADIIERAVERQEAQRRNATGEGLTLGDLERLGQEVGIDPEHLLAAAAELDAAGRTLTRQSSTNKTQVIVERWIDAPLTMEAWEDAVEEAQSRFGPDASFWEGKSAAGTVQQIGMAYEWLHTSGLGVQTRLTASERGGRTRLRLTQLVGLASPWAEGVSYAALLSVVPALIASVAAKGAGFESGIFVAMLVAYLVSVAVLTPVITSLDRRWRRKKLTALDKLADDLTPIFARHAQALETDGAQDTARAAAPVPEEPVSLLDLDALDAPEEASEAPARAARTRT